MKKIYDYMRGLNTKDLVDGLFNGGLPVERNRPKEGQKDYYFYNYDTGESSDYPLNDTLKNVFGDELYSELGTAPQSAFSTQPKYSSGDLGWNNRLEASNARHPGVLYAQNMQTHSSDGTTAVSQQVVSDEFLNQLGFDESRNNYGIVNTYGTAKGKYQMQNLALQDVGMMDNNSNWTGKYNVYSQDDFLNNHEAQEKVIHDLLSLYNNRYQKNGYDGNVGKRINGVSGETFYVTPAGMLAAAHREGQSMVKRYMNSLAQDANGNYYMDYNNLSDDELDGHFRKVERRLRRYENF